MQHFLQTVRLSRSDYYNIKEEAKGGMERRREVGEERVGKMRRSGRGREVAEGETPKQQRR